MEKGLTDSGSPDLATARVTSFCGSEYGRGRSSTALKIVKTATLPPMPKARVMTTTMLNPGILSHHADAKADILPQRRQPRACTRVGTFKKLPVWPHFFLRIVIWRNESQCLAVVKF